MIKKFVLCTLVVAAMGMTACGSKEVSIDVKALGSDLDTKIQYDDELMEMDIDTLAMFMNLSGLSVVNSSIYESSGATAEEIVVFECSSEDEAKKAQDVFKTRVEEQKESFTDYVPAELPKLDAAVIETAGKYAVLSVSGDAAAAKQIIDGYVK